MIRHSFRCSGIRACQYLDEQLLNMRVTVVDGGMLELLRQFRSTLDLGEPLLSRRNAKRFETAF